MASGSIGGSVSYNSSYQSFGLSWSAISNGSTANTSTLTINLYWSTSKTSKKWDTVASRTGNYVKVYVNGNLVVNDSWNARFNCDPWPSNPYVIRTTTTTITHNNNGTPPSVEVEAYANGKASSGGTNYGPGASSISRTAIQLDNIPRYANVSQSFAAKTETSITMNYSADATCNHLWYSINNGASYVDVGNINGTSGNYTITGLSPNTSYNVITRLRRSDSNLESNSGSTNIQTYDYPIATSITNYTIDDSGSDGKVYITFYNPLNRTITYTLKGQNDATICSETAATQAMNPYIKTYDSVIYNSIPNSKTGTFKCDVSTTIDGTTHTRSYQGGTYQVIESKCIPEISSISLVDTNNTTIGITGSNTKIISGYSTNSISVSGISVKNGASISSVKAYYYDTSSIPTDLTISGTSATKTNEIIYYTSQVANKNMYIVVEDSRGIKQTFTHLMDIYEYNSINIESYSVQRHSNFYSDTDFKVKANYTQIGTNTATIQTRYKKTSDSTWSNYTTLTDNVVKTISLDNEYAWNIEIVANDDLTTQTITLTIQRGIPLMFIDTNKNSVGINCFPYYNDSFEIEGSPINSKIQANPTLIGDFFGRALKRVCLYDDVDSYIDYGTREIFTTISAPNVKEITDAKITIYDGTNEKLYKIIPTGSTNMIEKGTDTILITFIVDGGIDESNSTFFVSVDYIDTLG